MDYAEAMKLPRLGWAQAGSEQMLAVLSTELARRCCLNAERVFNWAKRHSNYADLLLATERLINNAADMELLVAVINDLPLEK